MSEKRGVSKVTVTARHPVLYPNIIVPQLPRSPLLATWE